MKIVVENRELDTLEISDIKLECGSRLVSITISLIDKPRIVIGKQIPYETYPSEFEGYYAPYKKLYKQLKEKWESDKRDIPIFKIDA